METPIFTIKGDNFHDFDGFVKECNRSFISGFGGSWNGNLDAFDDYLAWGDRNYTLRWLNSTKSKSDLGYVEMEKRLSDIFENCHPSNKNRFKKEIQKAKQSNGQTLFELLIEIIEGHSDYVLLQMR